MLSTQPGSAPTAVPPPSLDLELSAMLYLLARAVQEPTDAAARIVAVSHLERLARHADAPPVLRRTAGVLALRWREMLVALQSGAPGAVH